MVFFPVSIFSCFLLLATTTPTAGLPSGAAGCDAGEAAIGGQHLNGEVTSGRLSDYGLEVRLNGETLNSDTPTDFVVGTDHTLSLHASSDENFFRGILFRLGEGEGGVDPTDALDTDGDNNLQVASPVCTNAGAGGLTHVDSLEKTSVSGKLRMDETDTNLPMDVTVVIQNREGVSIYYYSQFTLNAVEGSGSSDNNNDNDNDNGNDTEGDTEDVGNGDTLSAAARNIGGLIVSMMAFLSLIVF